MPPKKPNLPEWISVTRCIICDDVIGVGDTMDKDIPGTHLRRGVCKKSTCFALIEDLLEAGLEWSRFVDVKLKRHQSLNEHEHKMMQEANTVLAMVRNLREHNFDAFQLVKEAFKTEFSGEGLGALFG